MNLPHAKQLYERCDPSLSSQQRSRDRTRQARSAQLRYERFQGGQGGQELCRSSGAAHFGPSSLSIPWREFPRERASLGSVGIRLASHGRPASHTGNGDAGLYRPPDGEESKYLFIESAIVRWSSGCDAGWEIQTIDATSRARLIRFLDQVRDKLP